MMVKFWLTINLFAKIAAIERYISVIGLYHKKGFSRKTIKNSAVDTTPQRKGGVRTMN